MRLKESKARLEVRQRIWVKPLVKKGHHYYQDEVLIGQYCNIYPEINVYPEVNFTECDEMEYPGEPLPFEYENEFSRNDNYIKHFEL